MEIEDLSKSEPNEDKTKNSIVFFAYTTLSTNNETFFSCNKCKKSFKDFFVLKRHILEVEYNFKSKCQFCSESFKRINDHYPNCPKFFGSNFRFFVNQKNTKKSKRNNIILNNTFNIKLITKSIYSELISNEKNNYIDNSYVCFPNLLIGEGCYGAVVFGICLADYSPVAIKVQKYIKKKDDLLIEKKILNLFPDDSPFPKVYYHEVDKEGNVMVESLLGPTLEKLFQLCCYNLDLLSIYNIGLDLLECLQLLHDKGYVHLDLKLDNIAIKLNNIQNNNSGINCVLLDFGKAINYPKYQGNNKNKNNGKFGGNKKFSSLNILKGGLPSPKDDLISLIYLLIYLYKDSLPWSFINKDDKILYIKKLIKEKEKFNILSFCGKDFSNINCIYNLINKLGTSDIPNYPLYKQKLQDYIKDHERINKIRIRFKWEEKFTTIMKDFLLNNNYAQLNKTIEELFPGFPAQISYSFINQYSLNI